MPEHHSRSAYAVAIHEAGHAVVAYEQGRGSFSVRICKVSNQSEDYSGAHAPGFTDAFPSPTELPLEQWDAVRLQAEIVCLRGGEAAGVEFNLPAVEMEMSFDRTQAYEYTRRLILLSSADVTVERCVTILTELWSGAAEIVRRYRSAIHALAEELVRRLPTGELDGDEIHELIAAHPPTG